MAIRNLLPFSSFFFFSPLAFARLYLGAIEAVERGKRNEKKEREKKREEKKMKNKKRTSRSG